MSPILNFADIIVTKDGDADCRELADRHYSREKNKSFGHPLFVGPGKKLVLRNPEGTWVFAWRLSIYRKDEQSGWECVIFRNESNRLSSEIVLECERYVSGRKYTYINPHKIKSTNPGCCFKKAGWKCAGKSKRGIRGVGLGG